MLDAKARNDASEYCDGKKDSKSIFVESIVCLKSNDIFSKKREKQKEKKGRNRKSIFITFEGKDDSIQEIQRKSE
jgi:hypothetical protein